MAAPTDRERVRRIKYHVGKGPSVAERDDSNNPFSMNFLPMAERSERDKARWWALHGKRRNRTSHGEFDK